MSNSDTDNDSIESGPPDSPVKWEDLEETIEDFENVPLLEEDVNLDTRALRECCCKTVESESELDYMLLFLLDVTPYSSNVHCILDNLCRCFNYTIKTDSSSDSIIRLKLTDYFYRIRHELLFKALCFSYNLPINKSDMPFTELGLNSKRTPDYIYETSDGVLLIIEVTASSSFEKSAQSKGVEIAGFESKYESEMQELRSLGRNVVYAPIVFEMSQKEGRLILPDCSVLDKYLHFNAAGRALLRQVYNGLNTLTMNIKFLNMLPAALLFNDFVEINKNHSNLEFLYRQEIPRKLYQYKESKVSLPIYRKISNTWERIPNIINSLELDLFGLYLPLFNVSTNKITFIKDENNGVYTTEIINLVNNNNKPAFFNLLKINTGGAILKATESHTGFKIVSRVKKTDWANSYNSKQDLLILDVNHFCSKWEESDKEIDISLYVKKLEIYNSNMYSSVDYDPEYETVIFDSMRKLDMDLLGNKDLKDSRFEPSPELTLLSSKDLKKVNIIKEMEVVKQKMLDMNSFGDQVPLKKMRVKSPFILPLSNVNGESYSDLSFKNYPLIKNLVNEIRPTNPFTAEVLSRVLKDDYYLYKPKQFPSHNLQNLMTDRRKLTMEISRDYRVMFRNLPKNERASFNFRNDDSFKQKRIQLSTIDKEILKLKRAEGITEEISMVRLPSKNRKTEVGSWFQTEMSHFKRSGLQSTTEGVGFHGGFDNCYEFSVNCIDEIISILPNYSGENKDMVILDTSSAQDVEVLKSLKMESMSRYKNLIDNVKDSQLGHSAALVSRLCHSLLFYSQLSFNAERVRVDNLGYSDVLLIIRGGNKIFKSKSSKLFRLLYPIHPSVEQLMVGQGSTTLTYKLNGLNYCLSPWQMLNESILVDGLSFYNRTVSFSVLNSNPNRRFADQFRRIAVNVLLAFHNRRQSEVFLANMRYILLSCLGDFSGMTEIFNEFVGFNYDYFQVFLRTSFIKNFPTYFNSLRKIMDSKVKGNLGMADLIFSKNLNNIFTGSDINDQNDMALMIYSTFLMTKAPYKRNVERASNLKGILKIHEEFGKSIGFMNTAEEQLKLLNVNCMVGEPYTNYVNRLFSNDFNIDTKYISNLGVFADDLLTNKISIDQINIEWIKIMSESWDSMATSTGLRGDLKDVEDFWGKKGYFVVYKDLIKNFSFVKEIDDLFRSIQTDDEKRKKLRKLNYTYLDKVKNEEEFWIFHAVDKTQWRGGREIYVMDIHTKQHQQPIEKFMGFLCKQLDNELISIPSDRRSQVIHHSIFEKDIDLQGVLTWYLTLDCSKWAPKSTFIKFAVMVLNMSCIPSSFKTHFLNYLSKLYFKRIYFNEAEVTVLLNNPQFKGLIEAHLTKDESVGGYYLIMPYSWVMGIFNYTSSFMHAVNQEYASYLISQSSVENIGEETTITMYAHSDDSGGRISSQYKPLIQRGLFYYEVNLKSCNHLLSKKKSVVSRFYFEILSIIYLFKQLLALLPKFLGGIRFLPTDKGPAQDMSQAYSKCIEVMVAGADFSVAYLVMNFYSALVWRFYYNRPPNLNDFKRPVQLLGIPAAHPLMVLLCGSDSDVVRLLHCDGENNLRPLLQIANTFKSNMEDDSIIPGFSFKIQVRGIQKGFEEVLDLFSDQISKWSLKYVNFKNTPFNFINFLAKLTDPGFVGSLVNESTVRRLSRSYFIRSANSVNTAMGPLSLEVLLSCIDLTQMNLNNRGFSFLQSVLGEKYSQFEDFVNDRSVIITSQLQVIKTVLSGPLKICSYLDKLSFTQDDLITSHRTLKPTHLQIVKSGTGFSSRFDPSVLVSYVKEPEFRWALPDVRNLSFLVLELEKLCSKFEIDLEAVQPSFLLQLCRFFSSKSNKEIYLYSRVPSDLRQIKTYSSFLAFLSVNSFEGKEIKGMVLKLDRDIVGPDYLSSNINEDVHNASIIFQVLISLTRVAGNHAVYNLKLNPMKEIDWNGGTVSELCEVIFDRVLLDYNYNLVRIFASYLYEMIKYGTCSSEILVGSYFYTFTKRQKSGTGWFGIGQVLIQCGDNYFCFEIMNEKLTSLETNFSGKLETLDLSYIMEVLRNIGVKFDYRQMVLAKDNKKEMLFGFDWSGDVSIMRNKEMRVGVPTTITYGRFGLMNKLSSYDLIYSEKNKFKLIDKFSEHTQSYTIHGLESSKTIIIPIIKTLFDVESFEEILLAGGFGDFQEFIFNEVLMDYGVESYLNLNDFADNYTGSKLFEILRTIRNEGLSYLPNKIQTSFYPAPQGGMLRCLYEYSKKHPENTIVKMPRIINPDYMAIRSLFPEQFTAVLAETVNENFSKLFSSNERAEMLQVFKELCYYDDIDMLREKLIKIMSYWGYSSMVNVVQLYNFTKDEKNFKSLKWQGNQDSYDYYSKLFVKLHRSINKAMIDLQHVLFENDLVIEQLRPDVKLEDLLDQLSMKSAISLYGFKYTGQCRTLQQLQFNNLLITFLSDDDFVTHLGNQFRTDPLLSALPLDHKHRREVAAIYNNLKSSWQIKNKVNYTLDFDKRTQRIPDHVPDPTTFYKELSLSPKIAQNKSFHGQINTDIKNFMNRSFQVHSGGRKYFVKSEMKPLSENKTPLHPNFKFDNVLNLEEFEDNEIWQDFIYESEMADIDIETMEDILEELKSQVDRFYLKTTTLVDEDKVYCRLTWTMFMSTEGDLTHLSRLRQTGENLMVVTDCWLPVIKSYFNNVTVRKVNFMRYNWCNNFKDQEYLVYCIPSSKELNEDFFNKLLGSSKMVIDFETEEAVNSNIFINHNETIGLLQTSFDNSLKMLKTPEEVANLEREKMKAEEDSINEERKRVENLSERGKIKYEIDEAVKQNLITKSTGKIIYEKYHKAVSEKGGLRIDDILDDLFKEISLNRIIGMAPELLKGNITASEHIMIMQTPKHWGMAFEQNRIDKKMFKDKKVQIELSSLHEKLPDYIGSATLTISKKYGKIMYSNFNLWRNAVKNTKYKKANKEFLLTILNLIVNDAALCRENEDIMEHDFFWRELIENTTVYFGDEGEQMDENEMFGFFGSTPTSRIKYTPYQIYGGSRTDTLERK